MIVVVTGRFQVYGRDGHPIHGKFEWGVSHGIDVDTGKSVCMSGGIPSDMGAVWDAQMGEWVILDEDGS